MKTGEGVRKVGQSGNIMVTDRKRPIAKLVRFSSEEEGMTFAERPLVKGFSTLPKVRHDSTRYLSEDWERA